MTIMYITGRSDYADALSKQYEEGFNAGFMAGYQRAKARFDTENEDYKTGFNTGYDDGYIDGVSDARVCPSDADARVAYLCDTDEYVDDETFYSDDDGTNIPPPYGEDAFLSMDEYIWDDHIGDYVRLY